LLERYLAQLEESSCWQTIAATGAGRYLQPSAAAILNNYLGSIIKNSIDEPRILGPIEYTGECIFPWNSYW
jgi:hypothetical protein